jgi:hypothetical protein
MGLVKARINSKRQGYSAPATTTTTAAAIIASETMKSTDNCFILQRLC